MGELLEYKAFHWYTFINTSDLGASNTNELNRLFAEGWIPIKETRPNKTSGSCNYPSLLVILQRNKNGNEHK
jgi:hypothetical protein